MPAQSRPLFSVAHMNAPVRVEVNAFTHCGHVRPGNEDTITVAGWVSDVAMDGPRRSRHDLNAPLIFAVADGMGGHVGGEIASRYAIKRLAELSGGAEELGEWLSAINSELHQAMHASPALLGMGTTVAGLLLRQGKAGLEAAWFNVGDSRVYAVREGRLVQLSVDDVLPGPRTGMITQTLGGSPFFVPIAPHIGKVGLSQSARWLVCSDGLTDMLTDTEIEAMLTQADEDTLRALFNRAMDAGGLDNISIILVSVTAVTAAAKDATS
jgi:serine/threonine protein phosphatase PrpC